MRKNLCIVLILLICFLSTYTYAENENNTINATEKNQEISQANKIDIEQIINQNTNDGQTEQITKKEAVLEYLTEYRTNKENFHIKYKK